MKQEVFFENFEILAEAPNGVEKLREIILQFAFQGKLVRQDPNDEPPPVIIDRLRGKKEKLVKENRIKKTDPISLINPEELDNKLPSNWVYVKLSEIINFQRGKKPKTLIEILGKYPYINIAAFEKGKISYFSDNIENENLTFCDENNLLIVCDGSRSGLVGFGRSGILGSTLAKIDYFDLFEKLYLFYFLKSKFSVFNNNKKGAAIPHLDINLFKNLIFPIPSRTEQKRIVAKLDQLMALCDKLEARQQKKHEQRICLNNAALDKLLTAPTPEEFAQYWQRICDNFDLLYDVPETVGQMRQAILQLAVQGKLVAQDPGDEPASVLVEEIRDEKERLIKEKKIKKLKSSPSIRPEEIPYHKPENWEWIRLRDLGEICGGGTPSKNKIEYWDGEINWFSPKDMKNKHVNKSKLRISDKALKKTRLRMIPVNSILMVARSGILKRYFPVCINDVECTVNQDIKVLIPFIPGITQYLQLMLKGHQQFILENLVKGGMTVQSLKYAEFEQQPFPLPPKKELKRIVAKVDQLMALCDELEARLVQAQTEGGKLMEAVVHHVLAG